MDNTAKNELLLTQLVSMFHFAALQQMGKLKNPMTDKIEKDLQQSQASIDILEMLHAKMKGNLSVEEERMFSSILQELKLNYVDEASKPSMPQQPETTPPPSSPSA
jgi:hypothetical protein